jgi:hypothetical protein
MMPSGADLANSKATPGAVRGIFRGSDGIAGHADWVKVDLRQPALAIAAVSLAAGILGTVAVMKNAPRIKSWWLDNVVPTARNVWGTIEPASKSAGLAEPEAMLNRPIVDAFTNRVEKAVHDTREPMSSADAQRNLLEIMMAASIIADRMRALSNARIEDDAELPELRAAIDKLTTQQVTDSINQVLQSDSSLLDPDTRVIFSGIFGGGQDDEGEYVPITVESVRDAIALPMFEKPSPFEFEGDDPDNEADGPLQHA